MFDWDDKLCEKVDEEGGGFLDATSKFIKDIYLYKEKEGAIQEIPAKLFKSAYSRKHVCVARNENLDYICRVYDEEASMYNGAMWLTESNANKAANVFFDYLSNRMKYLSKQISIITQKCDNLSINYALNRNVWGELFCEKIEEEKKNEYNTETRDE